MNVVQLALNILLELNLCKAMFIFYIVVTSIFGIMINFTLGKFPLPHFILQAYKFGKMAHSKRNKLVTLLEVPKRWFLHFYISSGLVVTVVVVVMWRIYVGGNTPPSWLTSSLHYLTIQHRTSTVDGTSATIAVILMALHIYRRLYECVCVSVFSSGRINALHYIVGHTHYLGALALLLAECPGFDGRESPIFFSGVKIHHIIGTLICMCGYMIQHTTLSALAALRKHKGEGGRDRHMMPEGGLFQLVSCPHMLAEVLVYGGVLVVLWSHTGWSLVCLWVITNQTQVSLMNHKWYQETFKDYPKERTAIIPHFL